MRQSPGKEGAEENGEAKKQQKEPPRHFFCSHLDLRTMNSSNKASVTFNCFEQYQVLVGVQRKYVLKALVKEDPPLRWLQKSHCAEESWLCGLTINC